MKLPGDRRYYLAAVVVLLILAGVFLWKPLAVRLIPLRVSQISFCDDASVDGACLSPWSGAERRYSPAPTKRALQSWRDLGHHMYFHSRETPGVLLELNRPLSAEEMQRLESSVVCAWRLRLKNGEGAGHFEGVRLSADGRLWCFDYLGAMLNQTHKSLDRLNASPDPGVFPATLQVKVQSSLPAVSAEIEGRVMVEWSEAR